MAYVSKFGLIAAVAKDQFATYEIVCQTMRGTSL